MYGTVRYGLVVLYLLYCGGGTQVYFLASGSVTGVGIYLQYRVGREERIGSGGVV